MIEMITRIVHTILQPLVRRLIAWKITPNQLTTFGLIVNVVAAVVLIIGGVAGERGDMQYLGWASALILFAGLFDILDGQVARTGGGATAFGAVYDSVIDRYSELIMFLGICYYLVSHGFLISSLLAFIAMIGSVMVSYTRARAEGVGISCKRGLMQRPVRIIVIGLSGLLCAASTTWTGGYVKVYIGGYFFPYAETIAFFAVPIGVVGLLSNITAIGRLLHCKRELS
ncbi:MAG: CDP-alcohol phosphatidyltransferase family protein [Bacteroidota bacterium]|nr:CDP-alcohol phosphatidyltransferase family protein [Bacteroidota bacterium]